MIVLLVIVAALSAWGIVSTAIAVHNDGYRAMPTRPVSQPRH